MDKDICKLLIGKKLKIVKNVAKLAVKYVIRILRKQF